VTTAPTTVPAVSAAVCSSESGLTSPNTSDTREGERNGDERTGEHAAADRLPAGERRRDNGGQGRSEVAERVEREQDAGRPDHVQTEHDGHERGDRAALDDLLDEAERAEQRVAGVRQSDRRSLRPPNRRHRHRPDRSRDGSREEAGESVGRCLFVDLLVVSASRIREPVALCGGRRRRKRRRRGGRIRRPHRRCRPSTGRYRGPRPAAGGRAPERAGL